MSVGKAEFDSKSDFCRLDTLSIQLGSCCQFLYTVYILNMVDLFEGAKTSALLEGNSYFFAGT